MLESPLPRSLSVRIHTYLQGQGAHHLPRVSDGVLETLAFRAVRSIPFSSVQFSRSVVSNSLQAHGLRHTRLLCPPLSPKVCSNSCPSSPWCHPTISSSVAGFFSCPQSIPASGPFPMSRLFTLGSQSPEKAMALHSITLAWKIPWTEEPGNLQSMGSRRVGHDWATSLSLFTFMHWRRK